MIDLVKRLSLGFLLIAAASAVLLLSDLDRRASRAPAKAVPRIAVIQHANTPPLDDGMAGLLEGLAARGYRDGLSIAISAFNAQGDMTTAVTMARQATTGEYDLVVTLSTPSMQAVANNNREGRVRHVFLLVADPFVTGVGLDRADPMKHPAHMVGQGSFPPVERVLQIAKDARPALKKIGVAWNPAEVNSQAFVRRAREVAKDLGLELLEANVETSSAVGEAVDSLVSRGAEAMWMGGDTVVNSAVNTLIATAKRRGIPVFTSLPGKPDRGTLVDAGPDFHQAGVSGGELVADILDGADLRTIPIRDVAATRPPFLSVNLTALDGLRDTWRIPDAVVAAASVTVDAAGIHRAAPATPAPAAPAANRRPLAKTWKLDFIEMNQVVDVEEAESGVLQGLEESGLVRGRDFTVRIRNAQGDMATVSGLIDAALAEGTDLLVTFSTPTLQAALQRARTVPIVFNYVANAFAAGAGKTDTDHVPNVTGVYMIAAYEKMLQHIRQLLPKAKVLGTIYVPAEVNMVSQREVLIREAKKAGFEIRSMAANSPSEVGEAALALATTRVDAICQIPGNLTASAFPSIAQAANQARLPVFVFQTGQARGGALLAVARDYHESGHEAAKLAARVMRGESPATIPFVAFAKTRLVVNLDAARTLGIAVPADLVAAADEVVGKK